MNNIPYGKHQVEESDIQAVEEVLRSNHLTQGPKVKEFEEAFAEYVGSEYALAVANGTAALHLSALALGIAPGDRVILPPITFAATANCVKYAGGEVAFADIDPRTGLLDPEKVEGILAHQRAEERYVGVVPVDHAGLAVDLEKFRSIADRYGLWIIEDASHAPGAVFVDSKGDEHKCGNGAWADCSTFSFHPVKHIAAGEGGMITTNDPELYEKLRLFRTHGITKDQEKFQNSLEEAYGENPDSKSPVPNGERSNTKNQSLSPAIRNPIPDTYPGWYYELQDLGYNYRLSDIHAALGLSQFHRLGQNLSARRRIAGIYDEAFKEIVGLEPMHSDIRPKQHAYHLYLIRTKARKELFVHLKERGVLAQVHYIPLHRMPYYEREGLEEKELPEADRYYEECLSLPIFPALKDQEQKQVIGSIREFFERQG